MIPPYRLLGHTLFVVALTSCGGKEEAANVPSPTPDNGNAAERTPLDAAVQSAPNPSADAAVVDATLLLDAGSTQAKDSAIQSEKASSGEKKKRHSIAQLSGLWSGSAVVPRYGTVLASVRLNKKGKGSYSAKISGFTKTGSVQILSWNGKTIRARGSGMTRSVPAKLSGNKLVLKLPLVGTVTVYR